MEKNERNDDGTAVNGAGGSTDKRFGEGENAETLTNRQGHPITNNQNVRTVGNRGPTIWCIPLSQIQ